MVSNEVLVALIASAFPTIGIIGSAYFQYKASKRAEGKMDKADEKLETIHQLTNQSASDAADKINELNVTINKLEKVITQKDQQIQG